MANKITTFSSGIKQIHILHLVRSMKLAGAEILLYEYIKSLGNARYRHYVYNFGHDGPVRLMIEALGVQVILGPKRASIKNPAKFFFRLVKLIRDLLVVIKIYGIQMIQSHLSHANQLAVPSREIRKNTCIPYCTQYNGVC